jgi:AraC family transcriptional regulator
MVTKLSPGKFFGQMQRRIEVGGLTFAESVYASEIYVPPHAHENAFFYLVVEGVCEEVYGGKIRTSGSSSLVSHPAGESHSNRWPGAGGRAFHIDISRARVEAIRAYAPTLDRPAEFRGGLVACFATRDLATDADGSRRIPTHFRSR